jgi:hypothetical protein
MQQAILKTVKRLLPVLDRRSFPTVIYRYSISLVILSIDSVVVSMFLLFFLSLGRMGVHWSNIPDSQVMFQEVAERSSNFTAVDVKFIIQGLVTIIMKFCLFFSFLIVAWD